jgi:hypothetical protein
MDVEAKVKEIIMINLVLMKVKSNPKHPLLMILVQTS